MSQSQRIAIIGAGLAGCETALVLARSGFGVDLFEMRPAITTPAHKTAYPAELVCSNSFKSDKLPSAHGLLKAELTMLKSPLLAIARNYAIPAGSALAVDRTLFSEAVARALADSSNIKIINVEVSQPPDGYAACIIAAGPLVAPSLACWAEEKFGVAALNFYDAIAPVISTDSIDRSIAFAANRWEIGGEDYLNCPFSKDEYEAFYQALIEADETTARDFEKARFFEGCLPVEVIARRGADALRFGTMRPVGLTDPRTGHRPWAVVQLRRETARGEKVHLVGFQTRLTIPMQQKVFRLIPGLKNAEFFQYGSIHRNTYFNSPQLLTGNLSFKKMPALFAAGQITGNEGYTESIATGHLAAIFVRAFCKSKTPSHLPSTTALGALLGHIISSAVIPFAPSNVNFGLFSPLETTGRKMNKETKQQLLCDRAKSELALWILNEGAGQH